MSKLPPNKPTNLIKSESKNNNSKLQQYFGLFSRLLDHLFPKTPLTEEQIQAIEEEKQQIIKNTYNEIIDGLSDWSEITKAEQKMIENNICLGYSVLISKLDDGYSKYGIYSNKDKYLAITQILKGKDLDEQASFGALNYKGADFGDEENIFLGLGKTYGDMRNETLGVISIHLQKKLETFSTLDIITNNPKGPNTSMIPSFFIQEMHKFLIQLRQFCIEFECPLSAFNTTEDAENNIITFNFTKENLKEIFISAAKIVADLYESKPQLKDKLAAWNQTTIENLAEFTQRYLEENDTFNNLKDGETESPES